MTLSESIPEDIINEIIDSVQDLHDVTSLHRLALTSHLFLPRSQYHLFAQHIVLSTIEKLNSFCDFLDAHPDRRPWVKSVTIFDGTFTLSFPDAVPLRLFNNLPNLHRCTVGGHPGCDLTFPNSTPELQGPSFQHHAPVITHLHISGISFESCTDFVRYILAFPALRHLQCEHLTLDPQGDATALVRARERLSQKSHLSELTIRNISDVGVTLLLDSAQHALKELTINVLDAISRAEEVPALIHHPSKLTSITLEVELYDRDFSERRPWIVRETIEILQALAAISNCQIAHIAVRLLDRNIFQILEYLRNHSDDLLQMCRALEPALLRLPRLQQIELCHELRRPLRNWTARGVEDYLPTLCERGLIDTRCLAPPIKSHSNSVKALAMSPDGVWVASGSIDTTIILWNVRHGTIVHEWPAHSATVTSLTFSQDGRYLASTGYDHKVMVWDVDDGAEARLVTTLEGPDVCAWSFDGTLLALGVSDGAVHVWNPSTNQVQLQSLEQYDKERWPLPTAVFSSDGRWIADGQDRSWMIWDVRTGGLRKVLTGAVRSIQNSTAVIYSSGDHSACVWDLETGDELAVLEGYTDIAFCNVAFSPDGTRVLWSSLNGRTPMRLWNSITGDALPPFQGHTTQQTSACFSPDGKYVASTSEDHAVRLWNTSDGSCIRTFAEHNGGACCAVFSPDGETLVSGGSDGRVCIRRLRDVCPEAYSGTS